VSEFACEFDINLVVHGHMHVPYRSVFAGVTNTHVYESGSGTEQEYKIYRYPSQRFPYIVSIVVDFLDIGGEIAGALERARRERAALQDAETPVSSNPGRRGVYLLFAQDQARCTQTIKCTHARRRSLASQCAIH